MMRHLRRFCFLNLSMNLSTAKYVAKNILALFHYFVGDCTSGSCAKLANDNHSECSFRETVLVYPFFRLMFQLLFSELLMMWENNALQSPRKNGCIRINTPFITCLIYERMTVPGLRCIDRMRSTLKKPFNIHFIYCSWLNFLVCAIRSVL